MTTSTVQPACIAGELSRKYNGARFRFTFIMDQNSPKGIFAFGPDPPIRHPQNSYAQNSTDFAIDVFSLYQILRIWKVITISDEKEGRTPSWSVFKRKVLLGTRWESLEIMPMNICPEDHPLVLSEDYYCYKFNSLAFSHYFETSSAILNTCISWGGDREGALEVLDEIYDSGILGYYSVSDYRYHASVVLNRSLPESHPAARNLRMEMQGHRDILHRRIQEFFKPVSLRLTDTEFKSIERRVMGRPLMRELGIEECPDCPICMEQIRSRQHCTVLPCKHLMHVNCAKQWLMEHCTKPTCPLCRCCCRPQQNISSNEDELSTADTEIVTPLTPLPIADEDYDSVPELEEDYDSMPELIDDGYEIDESNNIISSIDQEVTPIDNRDFQMPNFSPDISAQDLTEIIRILANDDPVLRAGIMNINTVNV